MSTAPKKTQPPFTPTPAPATTPGKPQARAVQPAAPTLPPRRPVKPAPVPVPEPEPEPETNELAEALQEDVDNAEAAEQAHEEAEQAAMDALVEEGQQEGAQEEMGDPIDTEGEDNALFPDADSLAEAEGMWSGAEEMQKASQPVGNFVAEITEAELTRSASSDRLQIHYGLLLVGGQSDGLQLNKYDGMGSPEQANITRQGLAKLGVNVANVTMKTLPATLLKLVGMRVRIRTARNKGGYYNIYFDKPVGTAVGGTAPAQRKPAGAPSRPRRF